MNIHAEKLKLIEWLVGLSDASILQKLKWLRDNPREAKDWWDELWDAEKASIERDLEDSRSGRVTPHSLVRKKYEKRL